MPCLSWCIKVQEGLLALERNGRVCWEMICPYHDFYLVEKNRKYRTTFFSDFSWIVNLYNCIVDILHWWEVAHQKNGKRIGKVVCPTLWNQEMSWSCFTSKKQPLKKRLWNATNNWIQSCSINVVYLVGVTFSSRYRRKSCGGMWYHLIALSILICMWMRAASSLCLSWIRWNKIQICTASVSNGELKVILLFDKSFGKEKN